MSAVFLTNWISNHGFFRWLRLSTALSLDVTSVDNDNDNGNYNDNGDTEVIRLERSRRIIVFAIGTKISQQLSVLMSI